MWKWNASPIFGKNQGDLKCKIPPSHGADYICTLPKSAKDKLYYFYCYCVFNRHNSEDGPRDGERRRKNEKIHGGFDDIEHAFLLKKKVIINHKYINKIYNTSKTMLSSNVT